MQASFLEEPELQFGQGGTHIDVRFGLSQFGPLDQAESSAPLKINIGIVGTPRTIECLLRWLDRCRSEIPGPGKGLRNLHPAFPGFSGDSPLRGELVFDKRWTASLSEREIKSVADDSNPASRVSRSVDLFVAQARRVSENGGPDVWICAPPDDLLHHFDLAPAPQTDRIEAELDEGGDPGAGPPPPAAPFHDLLKARSMGVSIPVQMVRPATYGLRPTSRPTRVRPPRSPIQDEATRAWNFHLALYYKAGGIPWRLLREASDLSTCFVGISFYRTPNRQATYTSMAQIFNERGEGVIVRGGEAGKTWPERAPHLSREEAERLLTAALATYRDEHKTLPARLVVHKTSRSNADELSGFQSAADQHRIDVIDVLAVSRSFTRLFRTGTYPPLRGTLVSLSERRGILYLRGSVPFFKGYPGLYVPRPFEFVTEQGDVTERQVADELMSLSKLNWNNTQFDGGEPMTVRAARRVGDILKHVAADGGIQPRFRFYM